MENIKRINDAVGNKISETDALGNVTQYLYDAQNNLVQSTFADNSQTSATYSAAGLLLSQTDEMSATTSFEYDLAGRKVKTIDAFKGKGEGATYEQIRTQSVYDYRGRRIKREVSTVLSNEAIQQ